MSNTPPKLGTIDFSELFSIYKSGWFVAEADEEINDEYGSPEAWRIYHTTDSSIEATVCSFYSGEHNNEYLAKLVVSMLNQRLELNVESYLGAAKQEKLDATDALLKALHEFRTTITKP